MPIRLIDTYTGLILRRSEITSLLKERGEFRERLVDVVQGATRPIDASSQRPSNVTHLEAFIAEYLAFAMFSHRWGEREITITDVRERTAGIYSIVDAPRHLSGKMATDFLDGAKKLQEFCCVAAKCGYRWAWADTCCIDERVYGEKSESLNSMFLWYNNSDLTIVYLGDVEDVVEEDRLPAMESQDGVPWSHNPEIQNPFPPSYPYSPNASDPVVTLHDCAQEESPLQLTSMQRDTQVETSKLEDHLKLKFPYVPDWIARHIYRGIPAWVTRGWTLQEMLASKRLRFYSKNWSLLEEANDPYTDDAEKMIAISSFKYRARVVDHRESPIWCDALHRTTDVPKKDLIKFEPGPKDVRTRLRWAARRRTEKVEDMAYCMLGIFDVTLPGMYGEGNRAFFRLQEEIMKRTGDTSLFDWCGHSSSVNSFLAHRSECYIEPNYPEPYFEDWTGSTFKMIVDLLGAILGTMWSGVKAAVSEVLDWIKNVMKSSPPGHTLINGKLNVSLFEHQVKCCERVESSSSEDPYCHYKLEIDGLKPTHVVLKSRALSLENKPTSYYVCRVWNQHTHKVFHILLELIEYIFKDTLKEVWTEIRGEDAESESESGRPSSCKWRPLNYHPDGTLTVAKPWPTTRRTKQKRNCEQKWRRSGNKCWGSSNTRSRRSWYASRMGVV